MHKNRFYIAVALVIIFLPTTKASNRPLFNNPKVVDSSKVNKTQPLVYGFYGKVLYVKGIAIRSSKNTSDKALEAAGDIVKVMLQYMPEVNQNLAQFGAEMHLYDKDQELSDTPEYADKKDSTVIYNGNVVSFSQRYHGYTRLFSTFDETNLLGLSKDDHKGYSICTHEFAHLIMGFGLDDNIRAKIKNQYQQAMASGLWKGGYAATNEREYWAELSTWYFGSKWRFLGLDKPYVSGRESLEAYDPGGYNLAYLIYTGQMAPATSTIVVAQPILTKAALVPDRRLGKLIIFNDSPHTLKIFWVDHNGQPRQYGAVSPFSDYNRTAFYSDVWFLEDEWGKQIKYFTAGSSVHKIKVSSFYN